MPKYVIERTVPSTGGVSSRGDRQTLEQVSHTTSLSFGA